MRCSIAVSDKSPETPDEAHLPQRLLGDPSPPRLYRVQHGGLQLRPGLRHPSKERHRGGHQEGANGIKLFNS